MSHFSVAVFSHGMSEIEGLLTPYCEEVEPESEYSEFVKDDDSEYDEVTGEKGYWRNPNAKWDWYEIGGRWKGMLKLLPGKEGYCSALGCRTNDLKHPLRTCDSALVADCDFSPDEDTYKNAIHKWKVVVEGTDEKEGDEEYLYVYGPQYYLDRHGDKETYARRTAACMTYAFISVDGEWHGQGRMGWFGMDDSNNESIGAYEKEFEEYLEKAHKEGLTITIVDCHI